MTAWQRKTASMNSEHFPAMSLIQMKQEVSSLTKNAQLVMNSISKNWCAMVSISNYVASNNPNENVEWFFLWVLFFKIILRHVNSSRCQCPLYCLIVEPCRRFQIHSRRNDALIKILKTLDVQMKTTTSLSRRSYSWMQVCNIQNNFSLPDASLKLPSNSSLQNLLTTYKKKWEIPFFVDNMWESNKELYDCNFNSATGISRKSS